MLPATPSATNPRIFVILFPFDSLKLESPQTRDVFSRVSANKASLARKAIDHGQVAAAWFVF